MPRSIHRCVRYWSCVVFCFSVLSSCSLGMAGKVPEETLASKQLQRDTENTLFMLDQVESPECKSRRVANTQVIERPKDVRVAGGKVVGGSWKERWDLNRCGKIVSYDVEYVSDGKGGTFIRASLAKTSEGAASGPGGVNADLLKAAEDGDARRIEERLANGADIEAKDKYGRTPLIIAAVEGHVAALKLLLEKGSNVRATNPYGRMALHFAAGNGQAEVVRVLLAHGAHPKEKPPNGIGPIVEAAGSGSIETVQVLLENGADLNADGGAALRAAASSGRSEMVLFLLSKGVVPTNRTKDSKDPLDEFRSDRIGGSTRCLSQEATKALLERGSYTKEYLQKALLDEIVGPRSCIEMVRCLLERGVDINGQDSWRNTALIVASMWGHADVVQLLLSKGADVTIKNKEGQTALDVASNREIAKLIKEAKKRK